MTSAVPGNSRSALARLALLLAGACAAAGSMAAAAPDSSAKIHAEVQAQLRAKALTQVPVLVRLDQQADLSAAARIEDWNARGWAVYRALRQAAEQSQPEVLEIARRAASAGRAADIRPLWISNVVALQADAATVQELARSPRVRAILPVLKLEPPRLQLEPERSVAPQAIEWGVMKIRAPEVWSTYGVTGGGAIVANVDSGVQFDHPALVNQYRGNLGGGSFNHNYNWLDTTGASPFPVVSGSSHGTHTMGTIVGSDGGANQIGVAPGAKWIATFGCCPTNEDLLLAQQFILAPTNLAGLNPDPSKRPHVVNQSWGGPGGSEIFEDISAALRASGIFSSYSAGNNGGGAADGCGRLGSPGDNPSAFNVGSTDSNDLISSFSSRGPNPITGKVGPEVSAPGSSVRSSTGGGSYGNSSGTSMAAPHVAGTVALLISLEPKLAGQVGQLEELLRKTAMPLSSTQTCGGVPGSQTPNNVFGWGRIDAKAAADMVHQAGYIEGVVRVGGAPVADAVVSFSRLGKSLTTRTDGAGTYKVIAGAGTWAMSASRDGQVVNAASVVVADDATTQQDFALPAPGSFVVSGNVALAGPVASPVPAMIVVRNSDTIAPVWADAAGNYQLTLPSGSWELQATHPGTQPLNQTASAAGTLNFAMTARPNYLCLDNTEAGGPTYGWTDITDGTAVSLDDDASSGVLTLPGTFTYFGSDFSTVRINSNGFLFFGATNFTTANMVLPFEGRPNNDVMALGEDLNPALGAQGNIYWKVVGNRFVVQYHQVQHWLSGFPETFQIILDTDTDSITYQYHTLNQPDFTTVGLEDAAGGAGQLYSFRNSANLVAGRAVRFTPASGVGVNWGCDHALTLTLSDQTDPVPSGSPATYTLKWNVTGFGGAPQAVLSANLPAGATFVSASDGIVPAAGVLTWNLGNLRPNATGSKQFSVILGSGSQASVAATIADSGGESRSDTELTTIGPEAALFANGFE